MWSYFKPLMSISCGWVYMVSRVGIGMLAISLILVYIFINTYPSATQPMEKPVIMDPTYSINQIVRPGSWFIVEVRDPAGVFTPSRASVTVSCYISGLVNISLSIVGYNTQAGRHSINVSIPRFETPAEGFYPCSLVISDGKSTLISEKSVYIYNKSLNRVGILHITDIHLLLPTPIGTAYQTLTSAIFLANMLKDIDLVINTGDTADRPGDSILYTYYRQALKTLLKPILAVPGNHDGSGISPDVFAAVYGSSVGVATWYRRIENYLIVGLDTSARGVIDSSQIAFLERVLRENLDAMTKIILIHHPIFRASAKGVYIDQQLRDIPRNLLYTSWAEDEGIAREFLRLIDLYNVSAVLAGHVHQDSIVIYRNKTTFITTGTLGGPRSDYNAFRIIDAFSNGTVVPRYAPGTDARSNMNSYNVEKAVIRYWADRDYSGVFINISRDLGVDLGSTVSIYLDSPITSTIIEKISYDTSSREALKPVARIEIPGDDGAIRTLYRVDISAQDIYRPLGIIVRNPSLDLSLKPYIASIDIQPKQPRRGIDPIIVEVKVSRGSTYVYRVEILLSITTTGGSSAEVLGEALPSWDYTKYIITFGGFDASRAVLIARAYDLYGNIAEKEISIVFREAARTTATASVQITTITTTPVAMNTYTYTSTSISTTAAIQANQTLTTTGIESPAQLPTAITAPATQPITTHIQRQASDTSGLIIAIAIAIAGIGLVAMLTYMLKKRVR